MQMFGIADRQTCTWMHTHTQQTACLCCLDMQMTVFVSEGYFVCSVSISSPHSITLFVLCFALDFLWVFYALWLGAACLFFFLPIFHLLPTWHKNHFLSICFSSPLCLDAFQVISSQEAAWGRVPLSRYNVLGELFPALMNTSLQLLPLFFTGITVTVWCVMNCLLPSNGYLEVRSDR